MTDGNLVNEILAAGIFKKPEPPRDAWSLGTVGGTPAGGVAAVLIDGDIVTTNMAQAVACSDGDRVLTALLGRARIVVANLTAPAGAMAAAQILAALLTVDGPSSGLNADLLDGNEASAFLAVDNGADWTPSYSASGSMTVSSAVTTKAKHYHFGPLVYFELYFNCTLGGTASNQVRFTLPHAMPASPVCSFPGSYWVTNDYVVQGVAVSTTTVGIERAESTTNYVTGAARYFVMSGWYRPA